MLSAVGIAVVVCGAADDARCVEDGEAKAVGFCVEFPESQGKGPADFDIDLFYPSDGAKDAVYTKHFGIGAYNPVDVLDAVEAVLGNANFEYKRVAKRRLVITGFRDKAGMFHSITGLRITPDETTTSKDLAPKVVDRRPAS